MTAHELARILLAGPDLKVTRRGYEGGVHEVSVVKPPEKLWLDVHSKSAWYYGPHEYDWEYMDEDDSITTMAIHLW